MASFGLGINFKGLKQIYLSYFRIGWVSLAKKNRTTTIFWKKMPILAWFWPVFGQFWPRYQFQRLILNIFVQVLIVLEEICQKILINSKFLGKNTVFGYFWPVISHLWLQYDSQTLRDSVLTSVLVRLKWKTWPGNGSTLKKTKKCIFTPKMAKKWIFERGAQKILKNEGQICVQHEKICQRDKVSEHVGHFEP